MKFNLFTIASTVLAAATVASSQASSNWYKSLPNCALGCAAQAAYNVQCDLLGVKCICTYIIPFEADFEPCILQDDRCTGPDIIISEKVIRSLCFNCTSTAV